MSDTTKAVFLSYVARGKRFFGFGVWSWANP